MDLYRSINNTVRSAEETTHGLPEKKGNGRQPEGGGVEGKGGRKRG